MRCTILKVTWDFTGYQWCTCLWPVLHCTSHYKTWGVRGVYTCCTGTGAVVVCMEGHHEDC